MNPIEVFICGLRLGHRSESCAPSRGFNCWYTNCIHLSGRLSKHRLSGREVYGLICVCISWSWCLTWG